MDYIYLDTKIEGVIKQLIQYFDIGLFHKDTTQVVYKEYKGSTGNFSRLLASHGINFFSFNRYGQLSFQNDAIVYYLFNAQSNCRIVSNRKLTHIFVTHGESNKASSIKPIIRIYDYVIMSGDIGCERYLKNKIFFPEDIVRNRLIMMGNTFTGQCQYNHNSDCKTMLYAPTWEGGVPEENYSSIGYKDVFYKLVGYALDAGYQSIVIKIHPNLGHRNSLYKEKIKQGIELIIRSGLLVILDTSLFYLVKIFDKRKYKYKVKFLKSNDNIEIKEAFCDISAIETQMYDKNIPVRVFGQKDSLILSVPELVSHYEKVMIHDGDDISKNNIFFDMEYKNKLFNYSSPLFQSYPIKDRLQLLKKFIKVDATY